MQRERIDRSWLPFHREKACDCARTILSRLFPWAARGENEPLLLERVLKSFRKLAEFLRPAGKAYLLSKPHSSAGTSCALDCTLLRRFSHGYETSANLGEIVKRKKEFQWHKSAAFVRRVRARFIGHSLLGFFFIDISWQIVVGVRPLADCQMNNDALSDARARWGGRNKKRKP